MVTEHHLSEDDGFEYSYIDFSGGTRAAVRASGPLERWGGVFLRPLDDAIVWLDVNQSEFSLDTHESSWDEARLMVTDTKDGQSRGIDLGIRIERDYKRDGASPYAPFSGPADMTLAPGALVVQESLRVQAEGAEGSHRLVGVAP